MPGDILYHGRNVDQQEVFGFSSSLEKISQHYRWQCQGKINEDKYHTTIEYICTSVEESDIWWYILTRRWKIIEMTYDKEKYQHDIEEKKDNNDGEILTDDLEEVKQGEMKAHIEIEDIHKRNDKRYRIDNNVKKNSFERDNIVGGS